MWGTCLGFQMLIVHSAGEGHPILRKHTFEASNHRINMRFTGNLWSTKLFSNPNNIAGDASDLFEAMMSEHIMYENHHDGFYPEDIYMSNISSVEAWHVLSTAY